MNESNGLFASTMKNDKKTDMGGQQVNCTIIRQYLIDEADMDADLKSEDTLLASRVAAAKQLKRYLSNLNKDKVDWKPLKDRIAELRLQLVE